MKNARKPLFFFVVIAQRSARSFSPSFWVEVGWGQSLFHIR